MNSERDFRLEEHSKVASQSNRLDSRFYELTQDRMENNFLIYGANGFVGREIVHLAVERGLRPILSGRNPEHIRSIADAHGLPFRVCSLDQQTELDAILQDVIAVLHCAGPYVYTYRPMIEACLRTRTHYLDITGEIDVFSALADLDKEAKDAGIMILPGVGFDVVPTDCLAVYLKQKLPDATRLRLAFKSTGPAKLPPGTANTAAEIAHVGTYIRKDGELVRVSSAVEDFSVDFGDGPRRVDRLIWGDIFTAYHSTRIPNIETFTVFSESQRTLLKVLSKIRWLFRFSFARNWLKKRIPSGSTAEQRNNTRTTVWGEASNGSGDKVQARIHGPEAGVVWTSKTAISSIQEVLAGNVTPGFQTVGSVYGPDFVLREDGIQRENI